MARGVVRGVCNGVYNGVTVGVAKGVATGVAKGVAKPEASGVSKDGVFCHDAFSKGSCPSGRSGIPEYLWDMKGQIIYS